MRKAEEIAADYCQKTYDMPYIIMAIRIAQREALDEAAKVAMIGTRIADEILALKEQL